VSKATTTGNNSGDNGEDNNDGGDNDYNIETTYSHMKRSRKEEEESNFKIPKAWMHTLGALIVTNIVAVVVAGISLYVDVQLLKSRSVDQMRAINNLQDIVLYGRRPSSLDSLGRRHSNSGLNSDLNSSNLDPDSE
jgi:hypothetical protein